MEITTNIKKSDLIRFNLALIPRARSTYITILFITALVFAFLAWQKGIPQSNNEWLEITAASLGGGIGGMLAGTMISFSFILMSSSAKNGILGKHKYKVNQKGLHEQTAANEGVSKWEGIQEIQSVGGYLVFRISGYLYHIIPYRSFASNEAYEEFRNASIQYWRNAHNK